MHKLRLEQLSNEFHEKSEKLSKILLVIIIPLTAIFFWLFTYKKRKLFFEQMVFSTEVNCFYLLWGFLLCPLLTYGFEQVYHFFSGRYLIINEFVLGTFIYAPLIVFVRFAGKKFYNLSNLQATLLALLFSAVHTFIVGFIYKYILFVIIIYQI